MTNPTAPRRVEKPWTLGKKEIVEALRVAQEGGLSESEVRERRKAYGPNRLRGAKRTSAWVVFARQFKSLIVALLAVAAILSVIFGQWVESVAIVVVILINAAIGFFTEIRAVRSMESLRQLSRVSAKVRRGNRIQEVAAEELVPGDIVILEGGDIITADLRLIEASKLQVDESTLSGESVPVSKRLEPLDEETPLAERANMVFKGTAVTRGSGEAVVVATGMETELGQISALVQEAEEEVTPIEKRLDRLGHRLVWVTLSITVFVAVVGIARGRQILLMIETAIALAVAAIPEGLPIVATIALARGMMRMARRNALINRLAAVETLGATNIICTDKTGTLTENRMTVARFGFASGEVEVGSQAASGDEEFFSDGAEVDPRRYRPLHEALTIGVLCNNASLPEERGEGNGDGPVGDPLEVALLAVGAKAGLDRHRLVEESPEVREEAFDPDSKMMATFNKQKDEYRIAVKGAPEPVLEACTSVLTPEGRRDLNSRDRAEWMERNERFAGEGLRVLALANKTASSAEVDPYRELSLVALVGLQDPPRKDVGQAIALCQHAGIHVIMVTGDQPVTALNVGRGVGLIDSSHAEVMQGKDLKSYDSLSEEERRRLVVIPIFARVSPRQKLDLIHLHQASGSIVAMTGDGVNDAPALKKADIGIAMGRRGTQVAREAADMILKDDSFSTIVAAVEQGRVIYSNIRKFVLYLLSCNVAEVMTVALASMVHAPLPILPLQILFLNLVTDVFPALALGVGEGDPTFMKQPPRPSDEPIMRKREWLALAGYGTLITMSVLAALVAALEWLGMEQERAVTVSFLTLGFAQLWHVFNMRDPGSAFLKNDITRNPFVWGAVALCTALLLIAVYLPGLADVLRVVDPGVRGWTVVILLSLVPLAVGQLASLFTRSPDPMKAIST